MDNQFRSRLNYPDPFRPSGIEFVLPDDAIVTITIFDNKGQQVKTLITKKEYSAGHNTIPFDQEGFIKNDYFYRITATIRNKEYTETKRLL